MLAVSRKQALAFLSGTFISSLGSSTFRISLMAFMKIAGYSILEIGLAIGSIRFSSLIASIVFGDFADRTSVKKVIFWTEFLGAVLAIGLAWTWAQGPAFFLPFLAICIARSCVMAVQDPAKSKVSKLMSEDTYLSNSRQAIWLNKVTHGSMFFAAGLSLFAIKFGNFYWALAFDALTFVVNAFLVLYANIDDQPEVASNEPLPLFKKFKDLYHYNPQVALLDLLLAFALLGANLLTVRFAGDHEEWIPIYLTSYGFAVWVTGYLERLKIVRSLHRVLWVGFALSFTLLAQFPCQGWITFLLFLFNDHCYWLLFHRYSANIQASTPKDLMASVSAARIVQMIFVLATGEFLVGAWQNSVSVFWEGAWRAIFCLGVVIALSLGLIKVKKPYEEAA